MGKFFLGIGVLFCASVFAGIPNIFGEDVREPVRSNAYPWSTVGYLGNGCTGTLVGRDLVLTAAHCVLDDEGNISVPQYYPNLIDNYSATSSDWEHVWWGTKKPGENRGEDWAIIRLRKPLGDTYGWMGTKTAEGDGVTLVGYSGDYNNGRTATAHRGCSIRERLTRFWLHDCQGNRGSSGGPMFVWENNRDAYIVAIQVAEYRNGGDTSLKVERYHSDYANIAVPSDRFQEKIRELRAQ